MLNWAAMYDGQSAVALEAALMIEARTPQRYTRKSVQKVNEPFVTLYLFGVLTGKRLH
jgi:hypothetical protein